MNGYLLDEPAVWQGNRQVDARLFASFVLALTPHGGMIMP